MLLLLSWPVLVRAQVCFDYSICGLYDFVAPATGHMKVTVTGADGGDTFDAFGGSGGKVVAVFEAVTGAAAAARCLDTEWDEELEEEICLEIVEGGGAVLFSGEGYGGLAIRPAGEPLLLQVFPNPVGDMVHYRPPDMEQIERVLLFRHHRTATQRKQRYQRAASREGISQRYLSVGIGNDIRTVAAARDQELGRRGHPLLSIMQKLDFPQNCAPAHRGADYRKVVPDCRPMW